MLNIQKYGNTTSATLPLLLADYESQLKKGDNVIITSKHTGLSMEVMTGTNFIQIEDSSFESPIEIFPN